MSDTDATDVARLAHAYLDAVDDAAPGLVTALYLTGSIALGDFRPPGSDVDAVAVLDRAATRDDLAALRRVHESMPDRPYLDVIYLTADEFAARPSDGEAVPYSQDGAFRAGESCGQLNPVLWTEMAGDALTVRGPSPADLGVTADPAALREWTRGNLRSYWAALAEHTRTARPDAPLDAPVDEEMLRWLVLGPPRLYYTLATGRIASKTAAGRYAAEIFPEWADLCQRCVRSRAGEPIFATVGDMRSAAEFVTTVIDEALRLPDMS